MREGFTLVEGLLAIILLGVVVTALAPLMLVSAHQSTVLANEAQVAAVLTESANEFSALSFTELDDREGCETRTWSSIAHERCVTVTEGDDARERIVTIVIRPTNTAFAADSVVFQRTRPLSTNPFNTADQ